MITTYDEYNSNLLLSLDENPPIYAQLPSAENIYNVSITTRVIDAPKFLSVEKDHRSETIYFVVDRYADYMDLAQTCCIITYKNKKANVTRIYTVPFYDIFTFQDINKMLIPWCLDANVAQAAGQVEFAIQFYKIGEIYDEETNTNKKAIIYSLNTLPATSEILDGMEVNIEDMSSSYLLDYTQYQEIQEQIKQLTEQVKDQVYWTIIN